jgi:hypothetical protein
MGRTAEETDKCHGQTAVILATSACDFVKINVDSAFTADLKSEGWGAICRDSSADNVADASPSRIQLTLSPARGRNPSWSRGG